MRYFYDTEFIEDGTTIELVSIGVVAEDGREYYAVSTDFDSGRANPWVRSNVLDKLPSPNASVWKSKATIRDELLAFLTAGQTRPQLWAWVGAYDHVLFAQLFGDMTALPKSLPRLTLDIKQYWHMAGCPHIPPAPDGLHDAIVDARHNKAKFDACMQVMPLSPSNRVLR